MTAIASRWFSLVATPFSMQLALWTAMLSVVFQNWDDLLYPPSEIVHIATLAMVAGLILYLVPNYARAGLILFVVGFMTLFLSHWSSAANHSWLAVWTIVPAALISSWWTSDYYIKYLRYTLGIVMIAAGLQKVIAGTYFDGSYIAWLSLNGSTTEQLFSFLCRESDFLTSCASYQFLGAFIVVWQIAVGIFLLCGLRSLWVLAAEVGFLIGAGVYADEMNFQVLNIALLTIIFRTGMPWALFVLCLIFLVADVIGLGEIYLTLIRIW